MSLIRGIVTAVTEGMIKMFSASGRSDETFEGREYFQHYGYTSRPLAGAELILVNESNHIVAVASDDRRYRIAVEAGEVCIYTDEGDHIRFKRGREIYIKSGSKLTAEIANDVNVTSKTALVTASTSCQVNSPLINLGGDRGDLRTIVDNRLLTLFNNHVHSGVQTGSGNSGTPTSSLTEDNVCTVITKAR